MNTFFKSVRGELVEPCTFVLRHAQDERLKDVK